ncbi:MAG: amino acid permease [Heliobacteriaceae bacterium]|nr:amino acid permease [Heliobacteriaceae bacterium]
MSIKSILNNLLKTKSPDELIAAGKKTELKKTLNLFDLIVIGIGAVVGTGIFAIIGTAIQGGPEGPGAGPGIVLSMIIAALICVFTALCYSEIASMIPVAGSAYTYTYATMGEFAAWMVGWVLMLEYAIANITVASSWTGYLTQLLKGFADILPDWVVNFPLWLRYDYRSIYIMCEKYGWDIHDKVPFLLNHIPVALSLPNIFLTLAATLLLIVGVKESTRFAAVMVSVNLLIITSFVIVGAFYVKPENWTPFMPNGLEGVFMGAFIIFFAYIGFDAIATTAEESENPQKDLPAGIIGTLVICTILYVGVALVLTGIIPFGLIDTQAPIAHTMRFIGKDWYAGLISAGAVAGLASVFLVCQLVTTRILFAMSRDRFLPKSLRLVDRKTRTPQVLTWIAGIIVIFCSLFMDFNIAAELCNFGTFTSFIIICIAVLILRKTEPDRPRPFRVPFVPLVPVLGIVTSLGLMLYSMKFLKTSAVYFPLWLVMGVLIYASYSYKQKRLEEKKEKS